MGNVGVAGWRPFKSRAVECWSIFEQGVLLDRWRRLSTFLLQWKSIAKMLAQPVDKSVTKLWKDPAEGRNDWPVAIGSVNPCTANSPAAAQSALQGQAINFVIGPQSLVHSGFQLFHLPPDCVDGVVDKVRAHGCRPRGIRYWHCWLFFVQKVPYRASRGCRPQAGRACCKAISIPLAAGQPKQGEHDVQHPVYYRRNLWFW